MWQTSYSGLGIAQIKPRPLRSFGALQDTTPDSHCRYGPCPLLAGVSKWLSPFRFSSNIPRLGPLPLLLPVSKRPESIAPIFSQEQGVQSIYEFAPACGGPLVARNKNLQQLTIFPISLVENFTRTECLTCGLLPKNWGLLFVSEPHTNSGNNSSISYSSRLYPLFQPLSLRLFIWSDRLHHAYARPKLSGNSVKSCRIPCIAARNPSQRKFHRKHSLSIANIQLCYTRTQVNGGVCGD